MFFATLIIFFIGIPLCAVLTYIIVLIVKALRKYLKATDVRNEKKESKKTLGEILKTYRTDCKMTQEFVAESL